MERFLKELERALAKMSPAERAAMGEGIRTIGAGVDKLGGKFRPSLFGALGVLKELGYGMSSGRPFKSTVDKAKKLSTKIGPHVDAFLRAF